jgi:hypothetical protein
MYGMFACAEEAADNEAACDRRPSSDSPALARFGSYWGVPCDVDVNPRAATAALTKYDNITICYTQHTASSSSAIALTISTRITVNCHCLHLHLVLPTTRGRVCHTSAGFHIPITPPTFWPSLVASLYPSIESIPYPASCSCTVVSTHSGASASTSAPTTVACRLPCIPDPS